MKKTVFVSMAILALASCTAKMENITSESSEEILARKIQVNIADFVSADDPATKATVTTEGVFAWSSTDIIGVWPENVTPAQAVQQVPFKYSSGSGSAATFGGTGWGLICNGEYQYDAYFPYKEEAVDSEHIPFTYPANVIGTHDYINYVNPYLYMYAPAVTPADVEHASFNFYQLGALAKFAITAPQGVQYTKVVIKTADASNVFTLAGTYDLSTATAGSVTITPTTQTNTIGFSCNETLSGVKPTMNFWFPMCPAALNGKTLEVTVWDGSNKRYTGTKVCGKDQVSGKFYTYSVTVALDPVDPYDPDFVSSIAPVDLGHSKYLFAPMNLGATSIEETGDFFAWGEITTKDSFNKGNYDGPQYPLIGTRKTLDPRDDAAAVLWGNGWKMPDYDAINGFLQDQCDKEWVTINGTQGWRCYNKKDHTKWIFLPAGGFKTTSVYSTDQGFYWTITQGNNTSTTALSEHCQIGHVNSLGLYHTIYDGLSIRPVKSK